ncbi:hypothetical protein XELAEV_18044409mg [Xenopus laevis]|uniref:Uncharacterized protein n=1 Tax=Xenopus laevis TaxID=8355 RepID=A0A974BYR7_XENLA|nr:hypothetical protein XELAEV_18044409mg [Xenopus laevis]
MGIFVTHQPRLSENTIFRFVLSSSKCLNLIVSCRLFTSQSVPSIYQQCVLADYIFFVWTDSLSCRPNPPSVLYITR